MNAFFVKNAIKIEQCIHTKKTDYSGIYSNTKNASAQLFIVTTAKQSLEKR